MSLDLGFRLTKCVGGMMPLWQGRQQQPCALNPSPKSSLLQGISWGAKAAFSRKAFIPSLIWPPPIQLTDTVHSVPLVADVTEEALPESKASSVKLSLLELPKAFLILIAGE